MAEPTAEHYAEASAWLSRDRDGTHYGDVQDLAHALAAAESRGQEREERAIANLRADYADKLGIGDPKACWDDIVSAAERKGSDEIGQIFEDVRAFYVAKYGTAPDASMDDVFAAAEARGFERGQREERSAVVAWLEAEGDFATADKIEHNAHLEPR